MVKKQPRKPTKSKPPVPERGRGRPPVINEKNTAILLAMFREDATQEEACLEAGFSVDAMEQKAKADPVFAREISQARQFAKRVARQSVVKAMAKDGQLALKYLERRDVRFKPKMRTEVTDEERAKQLQRIEEAGLSVPETEEDGFGLDPMKKA